MHIGPILSTSVYFGPLNPQWLYSVHFGPIQSILSTLVLFGLFVLIRSYLVHIVPIVDVTQIIFTVTLNYFYFVNIISSSITFFFAMNFGPSNFVIGPLHCSDTLHGLEGWNSPPINDRKTK